MYVSLTRTKGPPGQPVEIATIAGQEMLRWLGEIDGFAGLLMLSHEASAPTLALTFWKDREVADHHLVARMEFRDRVTAAVNVAVEETVGYDVTFVHLGGGEATLGD